MIGFTRGNWTILPQTMKVKGEEIEVPVKPVRYFPKTDAETGEITDWVPLDYWSYRVLLGNKKYPKGEPLDVRRCMVGRVKYRVKHDPINVPTSTNMFTQPTFQKERKAKDKPKDQPKTDFVTRQEAMAWLANKVGHEMAAAVMNLFDVAEQSGL